MSTLSRADIDQVRLVRQEAKALIEIAGHQIKSPTGTALVGCPDCDQFPDVFAHHCKVCELSRHHPLSLNGGALSLSKYSPVRRARTKGNVLLWDLEEACELKGIDTAVLYAHAPCGVAYGAGLDFLEVMRLLIEAKLRLKSYGWAKRLKIACFCHIDFNGGDQPNKKRTYFVDRKLMTEFLKASGREVRM